MSAALTNRLKKELKDANKDSELSGVTFAPKNADDITSLKGTLKGPEDSPYENGVFVVDIEIPSNYPFEPPKMRFVTKIWHPNISSVTGAICLDILKDAWSPALTIKTALMSLQALLSCPEPNDPQDAEVAKMYLGNIEEFNAHASDWTSSYAAEKADDAKIESLVLMGFSKKDVVKALKETDGDENEAVAKLLGA